LLFKLSHLWGFLYNNMNCYFWDTLWSSILDDLKCRIIAKPYCSAICRKNSIMVSIVHNLPGLAFKIKKSQLKWPKIQNRGPLRSSPRFWKIVLVLSSSPTFFSYPAHSIEGVLNMHPHQFRSYRFFQLLVLIHTIHKKTHLPVSFRDKSPW
jgi:hypothetical protein